MSAMTLLLRVLQASDTLNGDVEALRGGHVPVRMTTGNIDPAEDAPGTDL